MFGFRASTTGPAITFEEFLKKCGERSGSDPLNTLKEVLREERVRGVDPDRLPSGNIFHTLEWLAKAGEWKVTMDITVR